MEGYYIIAQVGQNHMLMKVRWHLIAGSLIGQRAHNTGTEDRRSPDSWLYGSDQG